MTDIHTAVIVRAQLKERLLALYPGEDDESIADTLEGMPENTLQDDLVALFEQSEEDKGIAAAISARIEALEARKTRILHRSEQRRAVIKWAMEEAGIKKIEAATVTLSLRDGRASVVIADETQIIDAYWNEKVVRSLNKAAIKTDLDAGVDVVGATLSNAMPVLSARTK